MLSFLYQLVHNFESSHGVHPNLLYLNQDHLTQLRDAFSADLSLEQILLHLNLELILSADTAHPRVAWSPPRAHAV